MLREEDIQELRDSYRRLFYKSYSPNDYKFLGVQFVTKEREPVILTGCSHTGTNIYCIAMLNDITQEFDSFEDAKRELGV